MQTAIRIDPDGWKAFLDEFSRQYSGRQVSVSLMSSSIVAWRKMAVARFNGIWLEQDDEGTVRVMITLESSDHGALTHTITAPTYLSWDEAGQVFYLEHANGSTDLLQLHAHGEFVWSAITQEESP